MIGTLLLLIADTISRNLLAPIEIPVGIVDFYNRSAVLYLFNVGKWLIYTEDNVNHLLGKVLLWTV